MELSLNVHTATVPSPIYFWWLFKTCAKAFSWSQFDSRIESPPLNDMPVAEPALASLV